MEIPGMGLLTATAAVTTTGNVGTFKSSREFAAFLGLLPPTARRCSDPSTIRHARRLVWPVMREVFNEWQVQGVELLRNCAG